MSSAINHRKRSHRSENRAERSARANIFYKAPPSRWKPSLGATMARTIRRIFQPALKPGRRETEEG